MDYFSVIVLIIVTFVFISDKNVKIFDYSTNEKTDVINKIENIKEKLHITYLSEKNMNYTNIIQIGKQAEQEYVMVCNEEINLSDEDITTIVYNYVLCDEHPCGFNLLYIYNQKKWSVKKIYTDIINYLNIFNKRDFATYGIILCKKEDLTLDERIIKDKLISYTPCSITNIALDNKKIQKENLNKIYMKKIKKANLDIILKIILLIISGSIITTNLIYSVINANNNINDLIISIVIYYCYSYIIRYIYKPIGKNRILATYIFPIYFIAYIIIGVYSFTTKVIKKVQAS